MSNTILTPTLVTREALRILHQRAAFLGTINRQYDDQYQVGGAKGGTSLKIRLPNQYTVRTGKTIGVQDVTEASVTMTISTQKGVDMDFSSQELTTDIDNFSKRFLDPAVSVLVANVEADALQNMTLDVYNLVGTPGTVPASMTVWGQARQKLNENLAPKDGNRNIQCDSATMATMVNAYSTLFQSSSSIAEQYADGFISQQGGFQWYENESIKSLTCGSRDNTTPLTNSVTAQTGASLICDGFDATVTIVAGDVFTIDGVYAVNPETKASYSHLQQFVVTSTVTTSGGAVTLSISPSIVASGPTQNVSNGAANDKALTFVGTASTAYGQNLAYHRDAFGFVTADLEMPQGVDFAARRTLDGVSMRIARQWDVNNDQFPCRLDILYGYKTLRAQLACRVTK